MCKKDERHRVPAAPTINANTALDRSGFERLSPIQIGKVWPMPRVIERPGPQPARDAGSAAQTANIPSLLLVRHGSTGKGSSAPGESKVMLGWKQAPLDEGGKRQAELTAGELAPYKIAGLYSSDLPRGKESAGIIGEQIRVKPEYDSELRPWNIGQLAGHTIREVKDKLAYYQENVNKTPPGGEAYATFWRRWAGALRRYMAEAEKDPKGDYALLTHSRNLLATPSVLDDSGPEGVPYLGTPATGSISHLQKRGGKWRFLSAPEDHSMRGKA